MDAPKQRRAFLVAGMHRSGTSAMARILSLSGAALPTGLMPGGEGNPTGHWEPQAMADFNDRILEDLGSSWRDPLGPQTPSGLPPFVEPYRAEAERIIRTEYGASDTIVVKDPRMSLLLDLWLPALVAEGYDVFPIVTLRRPDEVAASLTRRNGLSADEGLLLWAAYMIAIECGIRGIRHIVVRYEDVLADPQAVLDRIETVAGRRLPKRTMRSAREIDMFVDGRLQHHAMSGEIAAPARMNAVARLYGDLTRIADGHARDGQVWHETEAWLQELRQALTPLLAGAVEVATSGLRAAEQALRTEVAATMQRLHAANLRIDELEAVDRAEREAARERVGVQLAEALAALRQSREELDAATARITAAAEPAAAGRPAGTDDIAPAP